MRLKKIKKQQHVDKRKARLIARLMADGSVFKSDTDYVVSYDTSDITEAKRLCNDIQNVYGLKTKLLRHRSGINPEKKLHKAFVRSKLMYEDLQQFGPYDSLNWNVPKEIIESNNGIKREFLRTFFEDEGTVLKNVMRVYSINEKGLRGIQKLLEEFEIRSSLEKGYGKNRNVFAIVIGKMSERQKFAEKIGFLSDRKNLKMLSFHSGQRRTHHEKNMVC